MTAVALIVIGIVVYIVSSITIGRLVKTQGQSPVLAWFPFLREYAITGAAQGATAVIAAMIPFAWPFMPLLVARPFSQIGREADRPGQAFFAWFMYTAMFAWTVWALVALVIALSTSSSAT